MALVGALWPWRLTPPAPEQGLPSWRTEVRNSTVAVVEGLDSNYGGWHDADMLRWEGVYVAKCCELVNKVHVFIRFSFQVQCRYRYISIKTYMLSFTWSPEYLTHDCQRSSARQKRSEWTVQVSKFVPCRIHWIIMNYINTMNTLNTIHHPPDQRGHCHGLAESWRTDLEVFTRKSAPGPKPLAWDAHSFKSL
jgi:hypothetical protein